MMKTIGFLGCGNMGGAIARAVCKATEPENVFLANRTAAKAEALAAELGCQTSTNAEVAGDCDLIFLAVKPQMMEAMLEPLRFILAERTKRFVLCTMAAGLPVARIQEMAGGDYPVIRIMPNHPGIGRRRHDPVLLRQRDRRGGGRILPADGSRRSSGRRSRGYDRCRKLRFRLRPGMGVPVY